MKTLVNIYGCCFLLAALISCGGSSSNEGSASVRNASVSSVISDQANEVASEEIDGLAVTCAACHGDQGVSQNELWPNLAGQQKLYLSNQIRAFRDGEREEPTMASMVASLTDAQIDGLASHFSSLPAATSDSEELNEAGQNVRARCVSCHGMSGNTVASEWPNLAGQKAGYLEKQLLAYKSGDRKHPIMEVIASELTEQQIKNVSEYYNQL